MIKAGALLYAMFLVIVVTIISSSFILVNYYNSAYVIQALKQDQLYSDARSGIYYGLALYNELPFNTPTTIDLFADEQHQVTLNKKTWGAFYVLTAQSKWKNKTAVKSALVGANINEGEKVALYLADQNKPLSLTGRTNIQGDCYLPQSGVKRAYIEGKSFVGNKLINGIRLHSNKSLPTINQALLEECEKGFISRSTTQDSIVDYELVMEQDSIINSFQHKTLVLYSPFSITLSDKVIEGNIVILSDQQIKVASSAKVHNCLLYAKGIVLEESVEGNMQLFARDSICIKENTRLKYPSVVALIGQGNPVAAQKISIGEKVSIKGAVFLYNSHYDRKKQALLTVGKESEITGQLYSSELLELKGKVVGGVYCKKMFLKTASSVYENHLMDAVIDREALSEYFVGVPLTASVQHQRIIKWLN